MAFYSECVKCWDTPCSCGWEYRHKTEEEFVEFVHGILSEKDKLTAIRILDSVRDLIQNNQQDC